MKNKILELYKKYEKLVLYAAIGLTGATLDFILFLVLYNVFGIPAVISTAISISAGILNNFLLNTYFNFKVYDHLIKRFVSFYAVGLLGLAVSIVIISLLNGVFGVNGNLAKLASIPVIVILQYVLNKNISFSEELNFSNYLVVARRHAGLLIICAVFLVASLGFVSKIPYPSGPSAGPDEIGHYGYNVGFLLTEHRLPVAGVDDKSAYENCRNNGFGSVTCTYSYVAYPGFNYVVSAVVAVVAHDTVGVSHLVGARLASTLWGLLFIVCIYLTCLQITRRREVSALITATLSLIPQVVFVFSYINQDAHSLALSALVAYALVNFLTKKTRSSALLLAVSFAGLLPLAKYNYYLLAPIVIAIVITAVMRKWISKALFWNLVVYCAGAFLLISSFWFIRNIALYHNLLGQGYILELMAQQPFKGNPRPVSLQTVKELANLGFFEATFRSFWLSFGYMVYYLQSAAYEVIKFILVGCIVLYGIVALDNSQKQRAKLIWLSVAMLAVVIGAVGLSMYNSATYDLQPQGRYIFQIIAPLAVFLALAYRINNRMKYVNAALFGITLYCAIGAVEIFTRVYL